MVDKDGISYSYGRSKYYIGTGVKGAQYTLRHSWVYVIPGERLMRGDNYLMNLGRNWDKVVEKAKKYAKKDHAIYINIHRFGLNPYTKDGKEKYRRPKGSFWGYVAKEKLILRDLKREKLQKKWDQERLLSKHQGNVGEKIERDLTIITVKEMSSSYGYSLWLVMVDEDHNTYTWKCSSPKCDEEGFFELKRGVTISLRGTIKSHNEWNQCEQTTLTRCRYQISADIKREYNRGVEIQDNKRIDTEIYKNNL